MIEEKTTKTYRVVCDSCGTTSPAMSIRKEAIAQAIEEGFDYQVRWNGLEHFSTHLCPDCYGAEAEEATE